MLSRVLAVVVVAIVVVVVIVVKLKRSWCKHGGVLALYGCELDLPRLFARHRCVVQRKRQGGDDAASAEYATSVPFVVRVDVPVDIAFERDVKVDRGRCDVDVVPSLCERPHGRYRRPHGSRYRRQRLSE